MLRKLDIDVKLDIWASAFQAVLKGEKARCPRCGDENLEDNSERLGQKIGFLSLTCQKCGKTGYLSRVEFPDNYKK